MFFKYITCVLDIFGPLSYYHSSTSSVHSYYYCGCYYLHSVRAQVNSGGDAAQHQRAPTMCEVFFYLPQDDDDDDAIGMDGRKMPMNGHF